MRCIEKVRMKEIADRLDELEAAVRRLEGGVFVHGRAGVGVPTIPNIETRPEVLMSLQNSINAATHGTLVLYATPPGGASPNKENSN